MPALSPTSPSLSRFAIVAIGACALLGAAATLRAAGVDAGAVVELVRGGGRAGVLLYAAAYVAAAVFLLPGSALTAAAGLVWGPVVGVLVAVPSALLASTAAFGVGRTVARGWIVERASRDRRLQAIDRAVGGGGPRLVALLRLSPLVPFNLLNYALGASRVSLRDYVIGSALGMLPGTLLYVWLGSLAADAGAMVTGTASAARVVAGGLGVGATALAAWVVARGARRALASSLAEPETTPAGRAGPVRVEPMDAANTTLVEATRPSGWINPTPRPYDLVVVGGGPSGLVAAVGAAGLGARVALVERHLLGGDCLISGCVPSKALIRAARAARDASAAGRFGVEVSVRVDFARVMERLRAERAHIARHDAAERFRGLGIDVFFGQGRFAGPDAIDVGGSRLAFSRAVLATGARPSVPPIPGLDPARVLTSESVWSLTELPGRIVLIGGGPIGCELAQSFRRLGAEVDLIAASDRLLPRDEPDAAALLAVRLAAEGIRLHLGATVTRVDHGPVHRLTVDGPSGPAAIEADAIVVAAGRAPNVEGLGLDAAGIAWTPKGVAVDDLLRTTNGRVYAAGDVASAWQFTHAADALARICVQNALFFGRKRASRLVIPWVTYTDPEVAQVGLTVEEATRAGHAPTVLREPFANLDRAVVDGDTDGFAQLVLGRGGRILGATIVGRDAGDLIGEVALAMTTGLRAGDLSRTIHPYPTRSEILKRLGDAWQRTRLTPTAERVLRAVLAVRVRT